MIRVDVGYNDRVGGVEEGSGKVFYRTGVTETNVFGD